MEFNKRVEKTIEESKRLNIEAEEIVKQNKVPFNKVKLLFD